MQGRSLAGNSESFPMGNPMECSGVFCKGIPEKVSTATHFDRMSELIYDRVPAKKLCGIHGRKKGIPLKNFGKNLVEFFF